MKVERRELKEKNESTTAALFVRRPTGASPQQCTTTSAVHQSHGTFTLFSVLPFKMVINLIHDINISDLNLRRGEQLRTIANDFLPFRVLKEEIETLYF